MARFWGCPTSLLWLAVHFAAFRASPGPYVRACWWRLLRKRVRARAQFAQLLAVSKHAYTLYIEREKGLQLGASIPQDDIPALTITAIIEAGHNPSDLDRTLQSLIREGISAAVLDEGVKRKPAAGLLARTEWYMPLRAGDILADGAGAFYRSAAAGHPEAELIYADDDLLDNRGRRFKPHFKPDWNPELFQHFDFVSGSCIINAKSHPLQASEVQASAAIVAMGVKNAPFHIEHVLHHRVSRPEIREPALAEIVASELPLASVIIPTRNRQDLLRTCVDGVMRTEYPALEIIVVDNGSDDAATLAYLRELEVSGHRVLRCPGPFNYSAINNHAVRQARGELICLLNNDVEVRKPDWLALMAHQALRPDVGAVGAQLLYPDGRIQHAGVVIGVGNAAGHAHRFVNPQDEGYFRRHALPQFVSAVTAACLVVRADRFAAVQGLNEDDFAVAFNDVDLCLKLNQRGWQSFYEARAVLVHHESISRGLDRDPVGAARFAGELAALQRRWSTDTVVDPYHHPRLSRSCEQFVVQL